MANTADVSQVQFTEERISADVLLNSFRRLVWIGSGPPNDEPDENDPAVTKDVKTLQSIMGPLLTSQLGWHY